MSPLTCLHQVIKIAAAQQGCQAQNFLWFLTFHCYDQYPRQMTFKGKALLWLRISEAQSVVSWERQNIMTVCEEEDLIIL